MVSGGRAPQYLVTVVVLIRNGGKHDFSLHVCFQYDFHISLTIVTVAKVDDREIGMIQIYMLQKFEHFR